MWHHILAPTTLPPEHYALMTAHPIAQMLPRDRHVVGGRPRVSGLDGTKRLRLGLPTHDVSTRSGPNVLQQNQRTDRTTDSLESGHPAEVCVTRVGATTRTASTPSLPPDHPWLQGSVSLNKCKPHDCPVLTLHERRGLFMTQALVMNSASKSTLSSPGRTALATAPNCNVTGVAASSKPHHSLAIAAPHQACCRNFLCQNLPP